MADRPIDPVTITLLDGREHSFLLSMGSIRRLKKRLEVSTIKALFDQDLEAIGIPLLWESLLDKGDLTEEQFADSLPANLQGLAEAIGRLLGASVNKAADRPPTPTPETIQ